MPLLDRDTIVDRPVLLDRSGNKKQDEDSEQEEEVQVLGEGGGPTINGIEFEVGSYDIVAGANLASVLATGDDDGQSFKNVFRNAAIQLHELQERGKDITSLSMFAAQNNVDLLGIQPRQVEMLEGEIIEEPEAEDQEVNIDQIEEELNQSEDDESDDSDNEDEEVATEGPKSSIQVSKKEDTEEDDEE
jgi:hypothetical protein